MLEMLAMPLTASASRLTLELNLSAAPDRPSITLR
jgi:hypothetical protein